MLATRVLSALVFGPLLIAAGYFGGPLLWLLTGSIVTLGLVEFDRLMVACGRRALPVLTLPFGLGMVVAAAFGRVDLMGLVLSASVIVAAGSVAVLPAKVRAADGMAAVFGVAYVAWLASHFILLRDLPGGLEAFFLALIGTWAFDSGSYFAGKSFGRRKLAPSISPGKTVEGLIGGLLTGTLVLGWLGVGWLGRTLPESLILAVAIMVAAQIGDLAESALKRQSGMKDSGTLIPGHGGVLDRFDSLLYVMPVVYYLWRVWLGGM